MGKSGKIVGAAFCAVSGWIGGNALSEKWDNRLCTENHWECSTNFVRIMGEEHFRLADLESIKLEQILKDQGVKDKDLSECDKSILTSVSLIGGDEHLYRAYRNQAYDQEVLPPQKSDIRSKLENEISTANKSFMCAAKKTQTVYFSQPRPAFVDAYVASFK